MGLALARDERCLSHFSGLIPTIRSNENRSNQLEGWKKNLSIHVHFSIELSMKRRSTRSAPPLLVGKTWVKQTATTS